MYKIKYSLCLIVASLFFFSTSNAAFAALGASVTASSTTISPGAISNLIITLSNDDNSTPITDLTFNSALPGTLPDGLKVVGNATYSCTKEDVQQTSGSVTLATNATLVDLPLSVNFEIPDRENNINGKCIITVPVTAETSSGNSTSYDYVILDGAASGKYGLVGVSNTSSPDPTQTIAVLAAAKPTITKSFGNDGVVILNGNSQNLTINIANADDSGKNSIAINNFSVTDTLPTTIKTVNTNAVNANCGPSGNTITLTPNASRTALTITGNLAADDSCSISVPIEAFDTESSYQTTKTNTINKVSDFSSDIGIEFKNNATANIITRSPLRVDTSFDNSPIASGQSGNLVITLNNDGNSPLDINAFSSNLDQFGNVSYGIKATANPSVSCSGSGSAGTYIRTTHSTTGVSDAAITQTANTTIAGTGNCKITIPYVGTLENANTPATMTNTIPAGAVTTTDASVFSQGASDSVVIADSLRILKSALPSNPRPGNPVQYKITVQNWSTSILNNLVVTDDLTNSQTFLTGTIGNINYTPTSDCVGFSSSSSTNSQAVFNISSIATRSNSSTPASCVITFYAMTDKNTSSGTVSNVVGSGKVTSDTISNGGSSDTTSSTINSNVLTAAKTFNPDSAQEGVVSRMTIDLSNFSAESLANVSITDNLPTANSGGGQMKIADPANIFTNCVSAITSISANRQTITLSGASVAARIDKGTGAAGTCKLEVDVTAPAGTYNNTATINATQTLADETTTSVSASPSDIITYSSVLDAQKSFSPDTVRSGGKSTVTIRLKNKGSATLTNLQVEDPLPSGMALANPINARSTCSGNVSFTGNPSELNIKMSGATVFGGTDSNPGSCDMLFDVVATNNSNRINTIPVGKITADGDIKNQSAISATLLANGSDNITVTKNILESTNLSFPGEIKTLKITITAGASNVSNLSITDHFTNDGTAGGALNSWIIAPDPQSDTTCNGGTITANPSGVSISASGISLLSGASCQITTKVTINKFNTNSVNNIIPASVISTSQGLTNSSSASTSLLASGSDLGLTKSFSPRTIRAGEKSRLTINLVNPNSGAATNAAFIDDLGVIGLKVASTANLFTNCQNANVDISDTSKIDVSNATIPGLINSNTPGSCYLDVNVETTSPTDTGDYTNTIAIGSLTANVGLANLQNTKPATAILRVKTPLEIHLAIDNKTLDTSFTNNPATFSTGTASANVSDVKTMKISISNPNSTAVTKVSLSNILPNGLTIAQTPNASTTCTNGLLAANASSSNFALTGATVPAAGFCVIMVDVLSNVFGTYDDNISSSAITSLEGVTNENATNARIIYAKPPVVSKIFSPAVISSGGTSSLTIFLNNDNSSAITLSSIFTDTLPTSPGAMVIASSPNISGSSCSNSDIVAVAGSGTISYKNGAIIPSGGCFIKVDITATTSGTYTNRINAGDLVTSAGSNQFPATANLDVSSLGFVSGKIFSENTENGDFNFGSDTPIKDAEIELRQGSGCSGSLVSSSNFSNPIKTDVGGNYLFYGLSAGTYSLCQTSQPSQTTNGTTKAGTVTGSGTIGSASNPNSSIKSQIIGIVLNEDSGKVNGSQNNNFAENTNSLVDLTILKSHTPTNFGENSTTGVFSLIVKNLESGATSGTITVTDTLPTGMKIAQIIAPSIWSCSGAVGTKILTCTTSSVLNGNSSFEAIKLRVSVDSGTLGQTLINQASVSGGNETVGFTNNNSAFDSVVISATASVSGAVWVDSNQDKISGASENKLSGWKVELIFNGNVVKSTTTASDGTYSFTGISPGSGYKIKFLNPNTDMVFAGVITNSGGISVGTGGVRNTNNPAGANLSKKTLEDLEFFAGDVITDQSLPLDPSGIIYDSVSRQPISNAVITISGPGGFDASTDLTSGSADFTTGSDGFYQFLLNPSAPVGDYTLTISTYPSGYNNIPSALIPVCTNTISVPSVPNPANIQSSSSVPSTSTTAHNANSCISTTANLNSTNQATTQYFKTFTINPTTSGEVFNNHIPLDPASSNSVSLTKTSPLVNVNVGQLVPYKITAKNSTNITFNNVNIVDTIPAGFKYVDGSATVNNIRKEPAKNGRVLRWSGNNLAGSATIEVKLLLVVGSGVQTGKYDNRAHISDSSNTNTISNTAIATVNVVPDPLFDCSEIIGKVFDDTNGSGYPDQGEKGIPNVRVATVNGLLVTTDPFGRFHIACAAIPDHERGSNFIMKLDERTLPSGYQVSSENPRVIRLTRGKMTKLNFGATLYKTLRIDIREDAFEGKSETLKNDWQDQLQSIPEKFADTAYKIKVIYYQGDDEGLRSAKKREKNVVKILKKAVKKVDQNPEIDSEIVRSKKKNSESFIRKILRYILVETPPPGSEKNSEVLR